MGVVELGAVVSIPYIPLVGVLVVYMCDMSSGTGHCFRPPWWKPPPQPGHTGAGIACGKGRFVGLFG